MRFSQVFKTLLVTLVLLIFGIAAVATITAAIHLIAPYVAFLMVAVFILFLLLRWIKKYQDVEWDVEGKKDPADDQPMS